MGGIFSNYTVILLLKKTHLIGGRNADDLLLKEARVKMKFDHQ